MGNFKYSGSVKVYMSNDIWLREGEQTRITRRVREHVRRLHDVDVPRTDNPVKHVIYQTVAYIRQLPLLEGTVQHPQTEEEKKQNREIKEQVFRKRTMDEVLRDGVFPSCSDRGLLFRGLMVAQGVPTAYIETFAEEYLLNEAFSGHVFARVFHDRGSYIVDPRKRPRLLRDEEEMYPFLIVGEGLDSWDLGIHCQEDLDQLRDQHRLPMLRRCQEYVTRRAEAELDKLRQIQKALGH